MRDWSFVTGGVYLIGLTREAFLPEQFQRLPWQTSSLAAALIEGCGTVGQAPATLPALRDLNTFYDLQKAGNSPSVNTALRKLIRSLLRSRCLIIPEEVFVLPLSGPLVTSLRGPPVAR